MTPLSQTAPSITDRDAPGQRRRLFPAVLLSAVLATLAFPPLDWGWLAWIALAPLLHALPRARRPRRAFALGYLFGVVHWGWTVAWIGTTVAGWVGSPLGWLAWVGLVGVKAGWYGLFGLLAWWLARRAAGHARLLGLAAAWTAIEWLRTQGSLAMPWSLLGYSQYRFLPLIQAADLAGVFVVSFALVLANAALAECACGISPRRHKEHEEDSGFGIPDSEVGAHPQHSTLNPQPSTFTPSPLHPVTPALLLVAALLAYGALALGRDYGGPPVRLALMQTNVTSGREDARTPEQYLAACSALNAQVEPRAGRVDLVVWPESTAPVSATDEPADRAAFGAMARATRAYHLVGTHREDARGGRFNAAVLFGPGGAVVGTYDKRWLVPYGEWTPARRWMPFGDTFHYVDDLTPGATSAPLIAGPVRLSALICYESVFPVLSRAAVREGANLLTVITNDSWAGESPQPQQHIAMAAFRAVETRRYLASAATTGVTGVIAPDGRLRTAPLYREQVFYATARLRDGLTLYVRWGDWFPAACAAGLAALLWRGRRRAGAQKD